MRWGRFRGEQRACAFKTPVDVARGMQAKVTDFDEAYRQDMVEKTAREFGRRKSCRLIAPGAEDDRVVFNADDPCVADGDPVGVTAKILKDLLRSTKGAQSLGRELLKRLLIRLRPLPRHREFVSARVGSAF